MLNSTQFRKRHREIFEVAKSAPVQIRHKDTIYLVLTQEHYVDLVNKVKFPNLISHPVQTIVHFRTDFVKTS